MEALKGQWQEGLENAAVLERLHFRTRWQCRPQSRIPWKEKTKHASGRERSGALTQDVGKQFVDRKSARHEKPDAYGWVQMRA